jgi:hypothetical protein
VTADQPHRANCDGHPCPPWCVRTHDALNPTHIGHRRTIQYSGNWVSAAAAQLTKPHSDPEPFVTVNATLDGPGGIAFIPRSEATGLAAIIDVLGTATPEQHRELAEAIREVADEISGPEPEAGS